jgi:hypothetical protein
MLLIISNLKIRIGCDPGAKGGIAAIYENGSIRFERTPATGDGIDINALKNIFLRLAGNGQEIDRTNDVLVIIEDVHSIFGSSSKSNFQFGRALGLLEGIVAALDLPYVKVQPKEWQKLAFTGIPKMTVQGKTKADTKGMALIAAKRLFPNTSFLATERSKKDHDGIIDALLLSYYAKVKF